MSLGSTRQMAALATATGSADLTMVSQVSGRRGTAGSPPGPDAGHLSFPSGHAAAAAFATGVGLGMAALAAPVGCSRRPWVYPGL
jgi:membrane-associated phospholipid phosphatase